jgi:sugar O-acyltransferase (sialic acid O-acetyltransferase NeuD family)
MSVKRRFVVWGSSGHAKVLAELLAAKGYQLAALFDNAPEARSIAADIPLYTGEAGFAQWVSANDPADYSALVAIGGARGEDRIAIQALFRRHGLSVPSVCHPEAFVAASARIGAGTQVLAHALVAADASIGAACILNHKAAVDHECNVGDGVHLAPGVTLCGCVEIGTNVFIGAGSCVLPRIKIGEGSTIGAGSLVTCDIPSGVVAYGRPAKVIRPI